MGSKIFYLDLEEAWEYARLVYMWFVDLEEACDRVEAQSSVRSLN